VLLLCSADTAADTATESGDAQSDTAANAAYVCTVVCSVASHSLQSHRRIPRRSRRQSRRQSRRPQHWASRVAATATARRVRVRVAGAARRRRASTSATASTLWRRRSARPRSLPSLSPAAHVARPCLRQCRVSDARARFASCDDSVRTPSDHESAYAAAHARTNAACDVVTHTAAIERADTAGDCATGDYSEQWRQWHGSGDRADDDERGSGDACAHNAARVVLRVQCVLRRAR
jgi:hypothetical protein